MTKKKKKKSKNNKIKSPRINEKRITEAALPQILYGTDIPVYDVLEHYDINTDFGLDDCLYDLISSIEDGYYFQWEAVIRNEQGLPLNKRQKKVFSEIIDFSGEDGRILYIDEIPRPKEPWYETARKVVPKLILDPFETYTIYLETYHLGWSHFLECLDDYSQILPLPEGIGSPIDVIPANVRHRLWLQNSFNELSGLGQEDDLTLEDEDEKNRRIKGFTNCLRQCKDSVRYFDLTIETLVQMVKLPVKDEKIFVESMLKKLKMKSVSEAIYDYL